MRHILVQLIASIILNFPALKHMLEWRGSFTKDQKCVLLASNNSVHWKHRKIATEVNQRKEAVMQTHTHTHTHYRHLHHTGMTSEEVTSALHLKRSFFWVLALLPKTRKALSSVLTTFSRSSSLASKSSTQVNSWLSRWRRPSLLPVDCVASLQRLSDRTRCMLPNSWLISSILPQELILKITEVPNACKRTTTCWQCSGRKNYPKFDDWKYVCITWKESNERQWTVLVAPVESNRWVKWEKSWLTGLGAPHLEWLGSWFIISTSLLCLLETTSNLTEKCFNMRPINKLWNQLAIWALKPLSLCRLLSALLDGNTLFFPSNPH